MRSFMDPILEGLDSFFAWIGTELKQTVESYCDLETADDVHTLVGRDGSLLSVIRVYGITKLVGTEEFDRVHEGLTQSLQATLKRQGHALQVYFYYDRDMVRPEIEEVLSAARATAKRLHLELDDLFKERVENLARYCAHEDQFWLLDLGLSTYPPQLQSRFRRFLCATRHDRE